MSKKRFVKLSKEELRKRIVQYEMKEKKLKRYGLIGAIIGLIGLLISMAAESTSVVIFLILLLVGLGCFYLGVRLRRKSESLVQEQLNDFFEAELEKKFGPRMHTPEMGIDATFLEEINPVDLYWNRCLLLRSYEGNHHGVHFSAANVELYELRQITAEDSSQNATKTVFEGVILRCRDICDPSRNIALRRPWEDNHKSDLTDSAVFQQHFSARTVDGQPADDLVTPQLRELIRKLESLSDNYRVVALILHDGEATLALAGYSFADGLPSGGKSLQNLYEIRNRFTASLIPMCDLIDILSAEDTL